MKKLVEKYKRIPIQARAAFWFLICSFLQRGISMITTPIFTRLLTTSEYGQFSIFNSWFSVVTVFVTLNLYSGVFMQGLIKYDKERKVFSSSMQGLTVTLVGIWTVIYLLFHDFWNNLFSLTTVQMLAMLLMIWTSSIFNFWASEKRVEYKYKSLVLLTILVSIAKPFIGIIFVINAKDKVTARILGLALVELIAYFWIFVRSMIKGKKFYSHKFWKHALLFNLPLVPHYLSQTVLNSADRIMIGNAEAGIYNLAYSISLIMTLFNSAVSQTMGPWMYQKIKEKNIKDIAPISYALLILVAFANILLIAFAPEVIRIFAPESYYDAIWVIPPVALSVYFMFSYDLFAKFGFYYEKTKFIMIASMLGALLNIILNYIFINIYGYIAAGYTTLVCYIVYVLGHYIFMNKICDKFIDGIRPYNTKIILMISTIFVIIGLIFLASYNNVIVRYAFIAILFIISFIKRKFIYDTIVNLIKIKKEK